MGKPPLLQWRCKFSGTATRKPPIGRQLHGMARGSAAGAHSCCTWRRLRRSFSFLPCLVISLTATVCRLPVRLAFHTCSHTACDSLMTSSNPWQQQRACSAIVHSTATSCCIRSPCRSSPRPQARSACTRRSGSGQASCKAGQEVGVWRARRTGGGGGGGTPDGAAAAPPPSLHSAQRPASRQLAGGPGGDEGTALAGGWRPRSPGAAEP